MGHRTWRARCAGAAWAAALLVFTVPALASDAVLYRIFLRDGTTIVSYGDFARVAGRVVLSIPVDGGKPDAPNLQLISIPESTVDWERTDTYAEAARARRYADTRGELEFSRLSNEVADTLNQVAHTPDPAKRLALANSARRMLADWPTRNYGYRAKDVAQLSSLLDEVVSELRVAAGESRFDVSLVSNVEPPPAVPLMAPPTLRESIEQAFTAARLVDEPAERLSLLNAITQSLQPAMAEPWAAALHTRATGELATEARAEQAYADLTTRILTAAEQRARRADVRGIETLVRAVLKADDDLGRRRPQATAALLATLDARLDDARKLRLARDAWTLRVGFVRTYERRAAVAIEHFRRSMAWLEDIRRLAGPAPGFLWELNERLDQAARGLGRIKPPPELEAVHGMLTAAVQMAGRAAASREIAIRGTNMERAWEASAAAAGALLMFERAHEELKRLVAMPTL